MANVIARIINTLHTLSFVALIVGISQWIGWVNTSVATSTLIIPFFVLTALVIALAVFKVAHDRKVEANKSHAQKTIDMLDKIQASGYRGYR